MEERIKNLENHIKKMEQRIDELERHKRNMETELKYMQKSFSKLVSRDYSYDHHVDTSSNDTCM